MFCSDTPRKTRSPFLATPSDLLIEIALLLERKRDLLNFSLTSGHVFSSVAPVLYESVVLRYRTTRPRIGRSATLLLKIEFIDILNRLGGSFLSYALVKFVWDADEMPYHEDMWFALRIGCPQLKYVGTTVGSILPDLNSHLFDFIDLHGFYLTLKTGFYENHIDMFLDEDEPTFRKFSDMLIRRCPNLEELAIDGVSSVPADIHFVVEGRWPKLRKLTLGDVCIDWIPRPMNPGEKRPFIAFLEEHPDLATLNLSRHTIQPIHFAALDPTCLGHVTAFSGTHQQLQALTHIHRSIKSVTFRDPVETREVSAPTVATLLRELVSLEELRISFTLHSMYDSGNLLRSLIQSCPNLRHLELTCGHKPSFQLDAFAKTIRGFPKLRTLHLTIVKYPGDENLATGATRIATANPRLHKFGLTFIPPVYPVPLPFSLPYRPFPFPARASGSFELSCDQHGHPMSLSALEHNRTVWPLGLGVSSSTKKYVQDLRPLSSPGRRKKGLRGVLGLLFEQSAAGEEMRMIVFCTLLVCLAIWGFIASGSRRSSRIRGAIGWN
ncbi:hypothetical protein BDQ17DRAFT_1322512 [Cyathus striatus]|nr:hypothetical protein BDQ17DRAFT_1322512 [Cyathus striatus]